MKSNKELSGSRKCHNSMKNEEKYCDEKVYYQVLTSSSEEKTTTSGLASLFMNSSSSISSPTFFIPVCTSMTRVAAIFNNGSTTSSSSLLVDGKSSVTVINSGSRFTSILITISPGTVANLTISPTIIVLSNSLCATTAELVFIPSSGGSAVVLDTQIGTEGVFTFPQIFLTLRVGGTIQLNFCGSVSTICSLSAAINNSPSVNNITVSATFSLFTSKSILRAFIPVNKKKSCEDRRRKSVVKKLEKKKKCCQKKEKEKEKKKLKLVLISDILFNDIVNNIGVPIVITIDPNCNPLGACGSGVPPGNSSPLTSMTVTNYATGGTYLTVSINSDGGPNLTGHSFGTWCTDVYHTINIGGTYGVRLFCSLDASWFYIARNLGLTLQQQNINMLNYILNRVSFYESPPQNFTFGDVQTAILQTIIGKGITDTTTAPFTLANVNFILDDGLANGQFYRPTLPTDSFAIFVAPVSLSSSGVGPDTGTLQHQLLILQVTAAIFPVPCATSSLSPVPVLKLPSPDNGGLTIVVGPIVS
jgi:hypothetical protein